MTCKAIFIGIDPGLTGAIAVIDDTSRPIAMIDVARQRRDVVKTAIKDELDGYTTYVQLSERIVKYPNQEWHGWIETPFSTPGGNMMGTNSLFQTYGGLKAMLDILNVHVNTLRPSGWKKSFGLTKNKDHSLAIARELWPTLRLENQQDHNRAEAVLIAEYGRLVWHKQRQHQEGK